MSSFPYRHICIIGTSGTGKTTLARELTKKIGAEHIELDALFHGPNWSEPSTEEFLERIHCAMRAERWVVDGNYTGRARQLEHADLIIWLDYSFALVLRRILRRTFRRLVLREVLWNGNRESWRVAFSKQGMIYWVFSTYWRRRREFPNMLAKYERTHQMRFRSPREAALWLSSI